MLKDNGQTYCLCITAPTTNIMSLLILIAVYVCVYNVIFLLQGSTTLALILGTWALARGAGLTSRARLAANCLVGMAFVQVSTL